MKTCEKCKKEHNGKFGSGKFCCRACANSRTHSKITKEKMSKSVSDWFVKNPPKRQEYICENCGSNFKSKAIKKGRKIHCSECKRIVPQNIRNAKSIKNYSKRTQHKILKRAKAKCILCGWGEATCDIHHIIEKHKGGTDESNNLIIVCPNCHRIIHTFPEKFSLEFLKENSIEYKFKDWKAYYNPSNKKHEVIID